MKIDTKRITNEIVQLLVSNSDFTKFKFNYIINVNGKDFSMQNVIKDKDPSYLLNFYNNLTEFNIRAKKDIYNYEIDKAFVSSEVGKENVHLGLYILYILKTIGFMKFDLEHRKCNKVDRKFEVAINTILDNALRKYSFNLRLEKLYSDHYALLMFRKCYDYLIKKELVPSRTNHVIELNSPITEKFLKSFIKNNFSVNDSFTLEPLDYEHSLVVNQFIKDRCKSTKEIEFYYKAMTILLNSLKTGGKGEILLIQNCILALEKLCGETSLSWSNFYYEKYAFSYYQLFMNYYFAYINTSEISDQSTI